MVVAGISWGRLDPEQVEALLTSARHGRLTYDHVRSALGEDTPSGLAERTFTLDVAGRLDAARTALRRWAPHDGIGATVHPVGRPPVEGDEVLVVAPFGPIQLVAPNRVVAVVDEPDRVGFAYGTLPGHPEAGEELFLAERTDPGTLRLTVRIHARPATSLVRLATPLVTRVQRLAARRYLRAWAEATTEENP